VREVWQPPSEAEPAESELVAESEPAAESVSVEAAESELAAESAEALESEPVEPASAEAAESAEFELETQKPITRLKSK